MALNVQTFKTRAITALVFVVIMMFGLLFNSWSFFILFSLVHFGAWVEYQKLVQVFNPSYAQISNSHRYGVMIAGFCMLLFFSNNTLAIANFTLTQPGFYGGITMLVILPLVM